MLEVAALPADQGYCLMTVCAHAWFLKEQPDKVLIPCIGCEPLLDLRHSFFLASSVRLFADWREVRAK